jgi:hypothetical protein
MVDVKKEETCGMAMLQIEENLDRFQKIYHLESINVYGDAVKGV